MIGSLKSINREDCGVFGQHGHIWIKCSRSHQRAGEAPKNRNLVFFARDFCLDQQHLLRVPEGVLL